jgi:hypothetical protein
MTTNQSRSQDEEKAPPVVPEPVAPVTPSQCLVGHLRTSWQDKRGLDREVWNIAPVGKRTSRIVDVPINGQPNIYTVTHPRLWRCADCAKEPGRFVEAMKRRVFNDRRNRSDWTAEDNARYAELIRCMHFTVPLPRVARGRNQMRHITEEAIAWIVAQRAAGASLSRMATAVGVSRSEVSRISASEATERGRQERAQQKVG